MTKALKPTIVLLHGWDQDKKVWTGVQNRLARNYSTLALDLPGFGKEIKPHTDWGIPEYSEWLENSLQKENLQNVILIGHSFGGRIAAYIAHKNPQWLQALILSGAPCIYSPNIFIKIKGLLAKYLGRILPENIKRWFLGKENLKAREKGMKNIRYKAITFDQTLFISKIQVPSLIINGEKDSAHPVKLAKRTKTIIPNSILIILKNLGHNTFIENEDLFYKEVIHFIEKL